MKKIIAFVLCFFALLSLPQSVCALSVSAQSAVLIEAESGEIAWERNAHTRMGMASTTKIMTALCALESLPLDTVVTVPQEAQGTEGSSVYLKAGEKLTLEDLLYALMLQSANDAAVAVAHAVCGGVEEFAELMNAKARELGLCDTHFENPHGLDGEQHYTTAFELAKLTAHALKNEDFLRIVSTVKYTVPATEHSAARVLVNHNRLLRMYDDIVGVKTGFTKKCGRTLVSAAKRGEVMLVCVTLNAPDDWRDHRALLDRGFELYETVCLAKKGGFFFTLPLIGGKKSEVRAENTEKLEITLPKDRGRITAKTELPRFIYAGQKKGSSVGKLRFFCGERQIGELALRLAEEAR